MESSPVPSPFGRGDKKWEAAAALAGITLCVVLTVAVRYEPYTFIRRDGSFYSTITRGLVAYHTLDQRKVQPVSWYSGDHPGYANLDMSWSNIAVGRNGTYYPKHSYLISFAAVPFYLVFGMPGFLVLNALCVIAMLWAAYLIAARHAGIAAAAIAVLLTAQSPMVTEHTYHLSADMFNAALVALGVLALTRDRMVTAGVLLGVALWARPITTLVVAPVAGALLWSARVDRRRLLRFAIAAAIPLAAAALANTVMFGAPWITSYDRTLVVENRVPLVRSHREAFTNSLDAGYRLLFENREHGMVPNSLPSLIALLGLIPLLRRQWKLAVALAVAVAGFIVGYLRYRYFNARFFFAWQALLCVPLAVLVADVGGGALALGGALGARLPAVRSRLERVPRPVWIGGAVALVLLLVVTRAVAARRYTLSDHIFEAKVSRNGFPCDYFNMTHQSFECSRIDRSADEYTGLAIHPQQCRFAGAAGPRIMTAPPAEGGDRRIAFTRLPRGTLDLRFGIQDGSSQQELCFSASYAGAPPERLCARGAGQILEHRFEAAPGGSGSAEFALTLDGHAPRIFCFDGVARR
jgi:hypothetical protein